MRKTLLFEDNSIILRVKVALEKSFLWIAPQIDNKVKQQREEPLG